jgi:hypothetical protein
MKKLIFTCLLFFFLVGSLFAQRRIYPKSYFGVYLGINVSGFIGEYESNVPGESGKYRLRTQYGFYGNIYIQREFSIYTALEIDLKGAFTRGETDTDGVLVSYIAKTNLTTFQVPVLFNYTPRREWGLMIGPQFTYLISAKEPWYSSDFYKPDNYQEDVLFKFNRYTVDGVVAVNYFITTKVTIQLRYAVSLIPIVNPDYGNARNSSILLYLGMNISKSK